MQNPIMIGERVYLKPHEADMADAFARWDATEPETDLYGQGRNPVSPIAWRGLIERFSKDDPPQHIFFTVHLKEDDAFTGAVTINQIDWINRTASTASFMLPGEYRGRGYGTEAKMLLLEYAFDHLQLHALQSFVFATNARSAAALEKQGYRLAGRYRYDGIYQGVYTDRLIFDVTRPDWLAARDALKASREARDSG